MAPSPPPPVQMPPKKWTKVVFGGGAVLVPYYGVFGLKQGQISWRRYSAAPPFYTEGVHPGATFFTAWIVGPYTDFWFYSEGGNFVTWALSPPQL